MRFSSLWERHRNGTTSSALPQWPALPPSQEPQRVPYARHILLFVLTLLTTVVAGMLWEGIDPRHHPELFYRGIPYAGTLLTILMFHEMGHYLTARYYGMQVTLPYFLPAPPLPFFLGTFGAFIRMQSPPLNRRTLLYVGAAGPIAGFCVALPAMIYAYATSQISMLPPNHSGIYFGEPLLLQMISYLVVGPLPEGAILSLNSIGMAAWFGLLVTMFNLLPMGQLDGGHILYALMGPRARFITRSFIVLLLALGYFWHGWFLWAVIGWLTGRRHPVLLDPSMPLNRQSRMIAGIAMMIFLACFMPVPVTIGGAG